MKRQYHPYDEWEDWAHGMYRTALAPASVDPARALARSLLSHRGELVEVMRDVLEMWPIAASQNLSHLESNRRAWLGQAACSLRHDVPAFLTKKAWWELTSTQRRHANIAADTVIQEWEAKCQGPRSQASMF